MITSENGHFEFGSLKPGKFSLQGAKRGFIPAAYEQHEQFSTAIVTGAGFDTGNLVLRLTPLALLGGKVIDESGDPVRNARVMLYVEDHQAGMNRITRAGNGLSDDQGSYEFAALAPGNYYLSVAARPWYAVHPVSSLGEGAGLGLSVVHSIVQGHEGAIEVESTPGHGATFRVYLPAETGTKAP